MSDKQKELLSTNEAAELLGISKWALRKAVKEQRIPCVQLCENGRLYFDIKVLNDIKATLKGELLADEKPAAQIGQEQVKKAKARQKKLKAEIDWYCNRLGESADYNRSGWINKEEKIIYACLLQAMEATGRGFNERNETNYTFCGNEQKFELFGLDAILDFFRNQMKAIDAAKEKNRIKRRQEVATKAKATANVTSVTPGGYMAYGNIQNGTIAICQECYCLGIIFTKHFSEEWHKITAKISDPILHKWQDGNGIPCTKEGWLEKQEEQGILFRNLFF